MTPEKELEIALTNLQIMYLDEAWPKDNSYEEYSDVRRSFEGTELNFQQLRDYADKLLESEDQKEHPSLYGRALLTHLRDIIKNRNCASEALEEYQKNPSPQINWKQYNLNIVALDQETAQIKDETYQRLRCSPLLEAFNQLIESCRGDHNEKKIPSVTFQQLQEHFEQHRNEILRGIPDSTERGFLQRFIEFAKESHRPEEALIAYQEHKERVLSRVEGNPNQHRDQKDHFSPVREEKGLELSERSRGKKRVPSGGFWSRLKNNSPEIDPSFSAENSDSRLPENKDIDLKKGGPTGKL